MTVPVAAASFRWRPRAAALAVAMAGATAWGAATGGSPSREMLEAPGPEAAADAAPAASLEDAVGAVVLVALTEQFDGRPVAVNIDSHEVQVAGARHRLVTGRGRVEVGGAAESFSFRYRTLYDVLSSDAAYPTITIDRIEASGGSERPVPNDAVLVDELDRRVASALSGELGGRTVWLQLDRIESFEAEQRYVRIDASGMADFGPDGRSPARVEALYDRGRQAWLRVHYALESTPEGGGALSLAGGPAG